MYFFLNLNNPKGTDVFLSRESRRNEDFPPKFAHTVCLASDPSCFQTGCVTLGSLSPSLGLSLRSVTRGDEAN